MLYVHTWFDNNELITLFISRTLIYVHVCIIFTNLFLSLQAKAYVTFWVLFFPIMLIFFLLTLLHAKNNEIYANIIKSLWFFAKIL